MRRMTHVQRRANRYEFRYRLPTDLAGRQAPDSCPSSLAWLVNSSTKRFKREVVRSLHTNDPDRAKRQAVLEIGKLQACIDEARRFLRDGPQSGIRPDQVAALIAAHQI